MGEKRLNALLVAGKKANLKFYMPFSVKYFLKQAYKIDFGVFNVTMSMKGVDFMLCQFSFKNFKSYKDETVFDMQAANLPEFAENIIYCKPA